MKLAAGAIVISTLLISGPGQATGPWELDLVESAKVGSDQVLVSDVAAQSVPEAVGNLVLVAGGKPGQSIVISRRLLLRKLVQARLAHGVKFRGATSCRVQFSGQPISWDTLQTKVMTALQVLMPDAQPGAPASWLELDIPTPDQSARGDWQLVVDRTEKLKPGRNLIRATVVAPSGQENLTIQATLHVYGQVARAQGELAKGMDLSEDLFQWEWVDLSALNNGLVVGSSALAGHSLKRTLTAGDLLRCTDIRTTPVIQAGDPVELKITRGQVSVTVRAFARQAGLMGQTIPVRNELTGRMVNARVAGPGLVEWRR